MHDIIIRGGIKMKKGETICYYRPRGGGKNIYITMLYQNDKLRGSIIQSHTPQKADTTKAN